MRLDARRRAQSPGGGGSNVVSQWVYIRTGVSLVPEELLSSPVGY